jgi:hypothetical protein
MKHGPWPSGTPRRTARLLCVLLLLAAAASWSVTLGEEWSSYDFEGESFVDHNEIGGAAIEAVVCRGASGGTVATGIDVVGEWIELDIDLPEDDRYEPSLRFQGNRDASVSARLTLLAAGPDGEDLVADFRYIGTGIS